MSLPKPQDPLKVSTRTILALVQAKRLRGAAHELKKLEPWRKKIYGYDRLIAAIHSPLNNGEKLFFEAQAMVPDVIDNTEGDAKTRGNRTRSAVRRLMKARTIVRDDPEINALLKRCLASIQQAESKVSAAQGLALRGDWHAAYHEIRDAVKIDDSPEARETHKFIVTYYSAQARDEKKAASVLKTFKIGGAILVVLFLALVAYTCALRQDSDEYRRRKMREAGLLPQKTRLAARPATPPKSASKPAAPADTASLVIPDPIPAPATPEKPVEKPIDIDATAEAGTSLGLLPPGTKITLRYQSGQWRSWIRNGGFSPDVPSEGANKVHSLSIHGMKAGEMKVLQVVPFRTQESPFTYEVLGKYDAILLRINEEPGKLDNNDGVVTYGVLVTPPPETK